MKSLLEALQCTALAVQPEGEERLWVDTEAGRLLFKRVAPAHLRERAFFQVRAFDDLVVHPGGRVFSLENATYEVITLQSDLQKVEAATDVLGIRELYTHSDRVVMLAPRLGLDALVEANHAHWDIDKPQAVLDHGRPPIDRAVKAFWELTESRRPSNPERFRAGLFHEDLQVGNVLRAPSGTLHIIDPDPIWHAPSVLNLAHFLVLEVFAKQQAELLPSLRAAMLSVLEEERPEDFDFFVLLAMFRALVRRAFHAEYHHAGWCDDLLWYLDTFAKQYLEAVE